MSAADDVKKAWTVPGRSPGYHREQQRLLRDRWPVLAQAIEKLVRETPSRVSMVEEPISRKERISDILLIEHHRSNIKGCSCGWGMDGTKLGQSHADHVADVILKELGL